MAGLFATLPVTFITRRGFAFNTFLTCLPFALLGAYFLYDPHVEGYSVDEVIGWSCLILIFFGAGGIIALYYALTPRHLFTVTEEGIHAHTAFIPWSGIIEFTRAHSNLLNNPDLCLIGVVLKDDEHYLSQLPPLTRKLMDLHSGGFNTPLLLDSTSAGIDIDSMVNQLNELHRRMVRS